MKAFGGKLDEMHNDLNGEGTGIQGRAEVACQQVALEAAMEEFDRIETPETDSILRAAEARGVDAFTAKLRREQEELDPDIFAYGEVYNALDMAITSSEMFARQLREGKAE